MSIQLDTTDDSALWAEMWPTDEAPMLRCPCGHVETPEHDTDTRPCVCGRTMETR
jgi:hypothetical protein